jgi:hypothetical protein
MQGRPKKTEQQRQAELQLKVDLGWTLPPTAPTLDKLTVPTLKEILKELDIKPGSGNKASIFAKVEKAIEDGLITEDEILEGEYVPTNSRIKPTGGLGYLCPIPYGQSTHDFSTADLEHVKKYWHGLEVAEKWPPHLLSFEAWCGMTCYDENATSKDGGPAFQKLMLMVLGQGSKVKIDGQMASDTTWDADQRKYGPMFKTEQYTFDKMPPEKWYEGFQLDGDGLGVPMESEGGDWVSSGAHLSAHSRPLQKAGKAERMGLMLGNFSNVQSVAIQGDGEKYATKANHYGIYTKHDWVVKGMLQTGTVGGGPQSQTLGQSLVSPGVDKVIGSQGASRGQCWEVTRLKDTQPCMLVQNSVAAIYGLYYYPGCNNPLLNWAVEEYVPEVKQRFRIRFRCPNPSYGQLDWIRDKGEALTEKNDLPVYERLNERNRAFLNEFLKGVVDQNNRNEGDPTERLKYRPDSEYIGGVFEDEKGSGTSEEVPHFHIPRASRTAPQGQPTISPWMFLVNEKKQMQVAPFWHQSTTWHKLNKNRDLDFGRGVTLRNAGIYVAGEEKEKVAFGFRISQAFLLYPYRKPNVQDGGKLYRDGKAPSPRGRPIGYMTEPKYTQTPSDSPAVPLAEHVLNWDEWFSPANYNEEEWRRKLLAEPATQAQINATPTPAGPPTAFTPANADGSGAAAINTATVEPNTTENLPTAIDVDAVVPPEAQVPGQVDTNQETAQAASIAVGTLDTQNTVATSFGIPGMSLAETLKECDEKWAKLDFTDADVQKVTGTQTGLSGKQKELLQALKECGLQDPGLEEGAPKLGNEEQCHWRTARHSPWSHEQCYDEARLVYEYERMDEAKIAAYKLKYGHEANLIQDGAHDIKKISDVKISWGAKRSVMNDLISNPGPLHRLNLARILVIYFSSEGVGTFTPDEKRLGMRRGLGRPRGSDKTDPQPVGITKDRRAGADWERLWGPVFETDPESVLSPELKRCLKTEYMCDRHLTDDDELENCLRHVNLGNETNWETQLGRIKSKMTVGCWVTTPWHLEHLPYQKQYAVFRDGECFSEGCKRCSRPFYEYAYHVYADRNSKKGTFSYPQDLWGRQNQQMAPVPLHDPVFWHPTELWANAQPGHPNDAAEGGAVLGRAKKNNRKELRVATAFEMELAEVDRPNVAREYDFYTGGTMAWPSYQLYKKALSAKDQQRTATNERTGKMYFRRYLNLAYSSNFALNSAGQSTLEDKEQKEAKRPYYVGVPEGYMHSKRHKVKFGVTDYKVTRSHKYGNVCRDCAAILDKAHLFVRNNRWQFSGGLVQGNSEAADAATYDYWQHMFGKLVWHGDADQVMDNFLFKGISRNSGGRGLSRMNANDKRIANYKFDEAAKALAESLNARHKFPDNWTRLVEQPTIHIQGTASRLVRPDDPEKANDIEKAVKALGALFEGVDPSTIDFRNHKRDAYNPALKDMVREMQRKYLHNEAYAQVDYTKQFDSDVKRTEYRNCIIRWSNQGLEWLNAPGGATTLPQDGKKLGKLTEKRYPPHTGTPQTYYNCLVTDQYDPDLLDQRIRDFRMPTPKAAYRQEVYLATRRGVRGNAEHPTDTPTQWRGDGFICVPNGDQPWKRKEVLDDGRAEVQYRAMRQSRLFITYSLHRPISSEGEGRVILEKMADALYTLFGTDRWLSEMIVFGKMLKAMNVGSQRGDNVSKAMWGIIDKTKKQEAMEGFYGSRSESMPRTSYIYDTYETHVDKLEVDGGCEIGPKMGHPHFHLLLTINHFSYVQFDYFKMNTFLEIMFRGVETFHGWGKKYYLPGPFYGDNENPYVDIRLYPQDNWKEILAAYVRKNAIPSIVEVESSRRLPGTADQRRRVQFGIAGGVGPIPNPNP